MTPIPWSPFFFFHATSVPSVIVSLSFGIWISGISAIESFTRSRSVSRRRRVFRRSAERRAPSLHCRASGHLPVIRVESAHPAHRKYFSEFDSKFLRRHRRTDGPVQQSPRDAFSRQSRKSPSRRAA